ncbi:hypothetical protein FG05_08036 [Fusarium graminearum]|nr:hypothetical protein FG05_08036 [Fusarium graminearum]
MKGFLAKLAGDAAPNKTNFSATSSSDSFVVESQLENVNWVELTNADLDELQKHVVPCHDDLEPRNILIKRDGTHSGKWHVAAVINWEMAGFFPFAYEYGHKDAQLGLSNLHFSYYAVFKEQSGHLLARVNQLSNYWRRSGRWMCQRRDSQQRMSAGGSNHGGWRGKRLSCHRMFDLDGSEKQMLEMFEYLRSKTTTILRWKS